MEALLLSRNKVAFTTSLTIDVYVLKINCNPTIYWCYDAIHHGSIVAEQEQSGIHNNNMNVALTIDVYVLKINCNPTIYWCYDAIHHGSIVAEQEHSGIHNIFDYRRLCVKD